MRWMLPAIAATLAWQGLAAAASPTPRPHSGSMLFWTAAQKARWFARVEDVQPVRVVRRGGRVRPLPIAATRIDPVWTRDGRRWTVDAWMAAYSVSGVIVIRDGRVLLERYGLGRGPHDRWTSFSVAKSVTSLLVGAAVADGRLRLDDPVTRLVPELSGSAYDGVTVRQLLTMSSGAAWTEDYADPASDIAMLAREQPGRADALLTRLAAARRLHPPGTTWHYNTAETHLVGLVVSRAVGTTLSDYLSRRIWRPYGMERDAVWMLDGRGREQAGCCLSMTLRDYARLGMFALDGGSIDGSAVEPPGYMAAATSVRIANEHPAPSGYGYFWWIGPRAYEASGIFGQSILVYPSERIVIAVNSAWPRPVGDDLFGALSGFQGAARDAAMAATTTPATGVQP